MSRERQERLAQYGDWSPTRLSRVYDSISFWSEMTRKAVSLGCEFASREYARAVYRRASMLFVEI